MRIQQINGISGLRPVKFGAHKVPHLTIETNKTCNIKCKLCYNTETTTVYSLEKIKKKIDYALQKRCAKTITLIGGEPTLHPDICKIINYVYAKGIRCSIATNGLKFLKRNGEKFLTELIQAGLSSVMLHVDIGQSQFHDSVSTSREALFSLFERKHFYYSLIVTLYEEEISNLHHLVKRCTRLRFFQGIVGTSPMNIKNGRIDSVDIIKAYENLYRTMVKPTAYLPSNYSNDFISWLIYIYFVNTTSGDILTVRPRCYSFFRLLHRVTTARSLFITPYDRRSRFAALMLTLVWASITSPLKIPQVFRFLMDSKKTSQITLQSIIIQQFPMRESTEKALNFCHRCPDATIRDGKLTPVCIADYLGLAGEKNSEDKISIDLLQEIYHHLGES